MMRSDFPIRIRSRPGMELAMLEITHEDGTRIDFVITSDTRRVTVGKSHLCSISIISNRLARYEFQIDVVPGEATASTAHPVSFRAIERQDKRNRMSINGSPVSPPGQNLKDGDVIDVPGLHFRFKHLVDIETPDA